MFYSAQILSKKGPLGSVWIASWSQRGLKRQEVFSCSLPAAVDSIINPEAPLALRLSGQLLLGLVRLYLRKLQFLEEDAGLALRGLNRNAAAGGQQHAVDLPDGGVAPEVAITLQDGSYDPMAHFVGNELFPSFDSSLFGEGEGGALLFGTGGGASVTVAPDISELFGSHWTGAGEEGGGDALERRFSMELERLRSQGVEAPRDRADMFFGGGQDDVFSPVIMDDEVMAVPPEDLFAGPAPTPGKTPASAGPAPLPGLSDMRITPPSLPAAGAAADLLPDIGGASGRAATSAGTAGGALSVGGEPEDVLPPLPMEEEAAPAAAAAERATPGRQAAARRRAKPAQRRRRPQLDITADGRPATTMPSDEIRKLLADRKPLMTRRGLGARKQRPPLPPGHFDVVAQSEAARDSELYRPAAFTALAPELLQLFSRHQKLPGQAGGASPAAQRRRRSSRGAAGADEDAAVAAAGAAAELAAAEAPPPGSPMLSGGTAAGFGAAPFSLSAASDFGGPLSTGAGFEEDFIEPADTQQELAAAAAAPFPAGPEEEGEGEGAAAQRRGQLPLQPVLGSAEPLAELRSTGPDDSSSARSGGSGAVGAAPQSSFTRNTALVLDHLRREFAPSAGSKRRHPSHGDLDAAVPALSLDGLLLSGGAGGAARGRLDAARWMYECLVLRNTGFVRLSQAEPYGDIDVLPTQQLLAPPAGSPSAAATC